MDQHKPCLNLPYFSPKIPGHSFTSFLPIPYLPCLSYGIHGIVSQAPHPMLLYLHPDIIAFYPPHMKPVPAQRWTPDTWSYANCLSVCPNGEGRTLVNFNTAQLSFFITEQYLPGKIKGGYRKHFRRQIARFGTDRMKKKGQKSGAWEA